MDAIESIIRRNAMENFSRQSVNNIHCIKKCFIPQLIRQMKFKHHSQRQQNVCFSVLLPARGCEDTKRDDVSYLILSLSSNIFEKALEAPSVIT